MFSFLYFFQRFEDDITRGRKEKHMENKNEEEGEKSYGFN
jgi:uncharacterized protein YqfB (UPF0267 family)